MHKFNTVRAKIDKKKESEMEMGSCSHGHGKQGLERGNKLIPQSQRSTQQMLPGMVPNSGKENIR